MSIFWNPLRADVHPPDVTWQVVRHPRAERLAYEASPGLVNVVRLGQRHLDEEPGKCAKSRESANAIMSWNFDRRFRPITLTELNWQEDGRWMRCYDDVEDGYHRLEVAVREQLDRIWIEVAEYWFYPAGLRPSDRSGL